VIVVVDEPDPVVVVQVQVLSFLQDAKLNARAATAKIDSFFIVFWVF
jgi:hypothetical protein